MRPPRVLVIAGSDSSGGAGLQADLKTITALGGHAMTAVTAITAQNTTGVFGVVELSPAFVRQQMDVCLDDIGADAVKTGMLASVPLIEMVSDWLTQRFAGPTVIDPVMVAKSGAPLLAPEAEDVLRQLMLPRATVLTPNLFEASRLSRRPVNTLEEIQAAAEVLVELGANTVVIKAGHRPEIAADVICDGLNITVLRKQRLDSPHTHGSGCAFASAIAGGLAAGLSATEAIARAQEFVAQAIRQAWPLGQGRGPVQP